MMSRFDPFACIALSLLLALSGCGGGGGGGGAAAPAPAPAPIEIPSNLSATARDANNLISWTAVSGATSYNVYWSTSTGVNKTNSTKISFANSPQAHTGLTNGTTYYYVVTAVRNGDERAESAEASATPIATATAADPLYSDQWHLKNTGQLGGTANQDINVEPVWAATCGSIPCKGDGVRIAVVDDGLEIAHEDLATNIAANSLSHNYLNGGSDPTESPTDTSSLNGHGTSIAGIIAARDMNGLGVRGVAPRANMVGYNFLQASTSTNEADAMTRNAASVSVSNNSWGSSDDGNTHSSTLLWRTAIDTGLASGRGGRGTVYFFAGGNGGCAVGSALLACDNSNYDEQANYRGVMAIGAVNDQGVKASYSERGANLWVSAPGGESTHGITTTDRSANNSVGFNTSSTATDYPNKSYTKKLPGTSFATPIVSGVAALMLQANPNLGWRDVRWILARTARKNDAGNAEWTTNGATPTAFNINHNYGFGVVDADAAVMLAKTWSNLPVQTTFTSATSTPNSAILDNSSVNDTISISGSGISKIEYIEITFSASNHTYSGDLEISLTNTSITGATSLLTEKHICFNPATGAATACLAFNGAVFGSARHLGEPADGVWRLTVRDLAINDEGTFQSWSLKFYGH